MVWSAHVVKRAGSQVKSAQVNPLHNQTQMKNEPSNVKFINKFIYFAAIVYPLTTIPQIIQIFTRKSAGNVSLLTWILYDLFTLVFLWYAIENRIRPLVIEYSMWLIAQSLVVLGIFLY
jgi:uncharacterized protein with PQ loop repeat